MVRPTITKEEFIRYYAAHSALTLEELWRIGRRPQRCQCGEDICQGWQMISRECAESEIELGRLPASVLADWEDQE